MTTVITTINASDVIGNSRTTINDNFASLNTNKAELASPTFTGTVTSPAVILSSETASTIVSFDASKNIKSLALATYPSLTELSYVKGVTSAIQTQIGTKAPSTSPTLVTPTINTSLTTDYLTPSEIIISDGSKKIVSAPVATYPSLAELAYVKGVTSAIQTQINGLSSPSDLNKTQIIASATVIKTHGNVQTASAAYQEIVAWVVPFYGVLRIVYTVGWGGGAGTAYGITYKNGVAVSAEYSTTISTAATDDISVNYGDRISIYAKTSDGNGPTTISSAEIRGTLSPKLNITVAV